MAQRREIAAIYAAAIIQGVALVTFPAVSAVLTSPAHYGLTPTQYGALAVYWDLPSKFPNLSRL